MRKMITLMLVATACSSPATGPGAVELGDGFVDATGVFESGSRTISVVNTGEFGHTLVVADADGNVIDATDLIESGDEIEFTVNLPEGAYEFSCRIVAQVDGVIFDHYQDGMLTTVEVGDA